MIWPTRSFIVAVSTPATSGWVVSITTSHRLSGWWFGTPSGSARGCFQCVSQFHLSASGAVTWRSRSHTPSSTARWCSRCASFLKISWFALRKFLVLEVSSVSRNVVSSLKRSGHDVSLLIGVMRVIVETERRVLPRQVLLFSDIGGLSLRVFGLFSSSLLLFPQHFGRYVLRPSSGVCRTREPSQNFEQRPL